MAREVIRRVAAGLVRRMAPPPGVLCWRFAASVVAIPPFGVEMTKELLGLAIDAPSLQSMVAMENRTQVLASFTQDMAGAVTAFGRRRDDSSEG